MMSICDIPLPQQLGYKVWQMALFIISIGALKATILQCVFAPMYERKFLRVGLYIILSLYALGSLVNLLSTLVYGFGINHQLVTAVMQTNPAEATAFLAQFFPNLFTIFVNPYTLLIIISLFVLYIFIGKSKLSNKMGGGIIMIASVIGCIFVYSFACRAQFNRTTLCTTYRIYKFVRENIVAERIYNEMLSSMIPFPNADKLQSDRLADNVFLIIGESASRAHHSLYGYPLRTSPNLDRMKDSLFVFSDALTSATYTALSLERILTFKKDDTTDNDWYKYPTLVELFKNAGYKTYWLSNQESRGLLANGSSAIVAGSDVIDFVSGGNSEDVYEKKYDEVLIPPALEAISDPDSFKFVGIHLMGSHTGYSDRFPVSHAQFKADDILRHNPKPWLDEESAQIVADYDNSILYTDSILGVIISGVANLPRPSILVYLSDHGEHVYDTRDYCGRERSTNCVEVPFIIYANRAYREKNPHIVRLLEQSVSRPFSTANLIYSLMTLTGTSYPHYSPVDDVLSPQFRPRIRMVGTTPWKQDTVVPEHDE